MRPAIALACVALTACTAAPIRDESVVKKVETGMTAAQVESAVGRSYNHDSYGDGTSTWTYKYKDYNTAKLLHVVFGPDGRVLRTETQWDPNVYSKIP